MTATKPAPVAARPVRVTVELRVDEHAELRRLCDRYADEIGVPRVAGAEVFRALLAELRNDPKLSQRVGRELARTGGSRRHA